MRNGTSDDTFTELRHATVAAEQVLDKTLLKRAKKEIEDKQEKSYTAHSSNLSARQLASIAAIAIALSGTKTPCKQQQQAPKRKWTGNQTAETAPTPKKKQFS